MALADTLDDYRHAPPSPQSSLDLALASADLADRVDPTYVKLLLWKEAQAKLASCLKSSDLGEADRLRAELLNDRVTRKSGAALAQLPSLVRDHLTHLDKRSGGGLVAVQTFFGIPMRKAKRIVYVVDRSGSMSDSITYCRAELRRAVESLTEDQQFQVIFYSSGPPLIMPPGRLVTATDEAKKTAHAFVEGVKPVGQTDAAEALRQAFTLGPDTVYLLTDGEFTGDVPRLIDTLNRDRKVCVHTLCFIYRKGEAVLRQIAARNGGVYKYVGESDLAALGTPSRPTQTVTPPPPAEPMPEEDKGKLTRCINYLYRLRTCEDCRGTGLVSGECCQGCAGRKSYQKTELVMTARGSFRRTVNAQKGNGKTPLTSLQPTIDVVEDLLAKYGDRVPSALRSRAQSVIDGLKANNR